MGVTQHGESNDEIKSKREVHSSLSIYISVNSQYIFVIVCNAENYEIGFSINLKCAVIVYSIYAH